MTGIILGGVFVTLIGLYWYLFNVNKKKTTKSDLIEYNQMSVENIGKLSIDTEINRTNLHRKVKFALVWDGDNPDELQFHTAYRNSYDSKTVINIFEDVSFIRLYNRFNTNYVEIGLNSTFKFLTKSRSYQFEEDHFTLSVNDHNFYVAKKLIKLIKTKSLDYLNNESEKQIDLLDADLAYEQGVNISDLIKAKS